jgi:polar amino acid transport system substrate-binding protein
VLDGTVLAVQQAIALPKGKPAGLAYVNQFLDQARTSGFVERSIERAGLQGVSVAGAR